MRSCFALVLGFICTWSTCGSAGAGPSRTVRLASTGPAMLAVATAGPTDSGLFVIGYRSTGVLAAASHVNAYMKIRFDVVRASGSRVPREFVVERSIPIGREPNGAGFLSRALTMEDLYDLDPGHGDQFVPVRVTCIDLAFFVDGRWDSNLDRNYAFAPGQLGGNDYRCIAPAAPAELPADGWGFIVGSMTR